MAGMFCGVITLAKSAEAQCVASYRDIGYADGSARVKSYVCQTSATSGPTVRVEFNRLSEAAAGALLQGEAFPEMDNTFGNLRVLDTPVGAEAKKLFDNFGVRQASSDCFLFGVTSAGEGKGYTNQPEQTCGERSLWYLAYPDREYGAQGFEMPLPDDILHYLNSPDFPPGFRFYYNGSQGCQHAFLECTMLWRGAKPSDLADFVDNLIRAGEIMGYAPPRDEIINSENDPGSWHYRRKRYTELVNYLTRNEWPEDFLLVVSKELEGCDAGLQFDLHVRALILDVAIIENISGKRVSIDSLVGALSRSDTLRPDSVRPAAGNSVLPTSKVELEPNQKVAVPLLMSFVMSETLAPRFGPTKDADTIYARIRARPAGSQEVYSLGQGREITKTHASFGKPMRASPAKYIYGPAITLAGLNIDGKSILFDEASRNFMKLAAGEGYGSCPYLYAWRNKEQGWVRYGKVIEHADERAKAMTERVEFDGFPKRFRLAEEELEVAFIDGVGLEVELTDGTGFNLRASEPLIARLDGDPAVIAAGDAIDFDFALPANIAPEAVRRSVLSITGYYRRHSALQVAGR